MSTPPCRSPTLRRKARQQLAARAKGILGFPRVVKAGFMVGGQFGDGALRKAGKTVGYYNRFELYSSTNVPTTRRASARLSGVFGRTASGFSEPCQRSILPLDCG